MAHLEFIDMKNSNYEYCKVLRHENRFANSLASGDADGKINAANSGKELNEVLKQIPEYANAIKNGKSIIVVLIACNAGSKDYINQEGIRIKTDNTLAEQLVQELPSNSFVKAANGFVSYGANLNSKTYSLVKPQIYGVHGVINNGVQFSKNEENGWFYFKKDKGAVKFESDYYNPYENIKQEKNEIKK